jgi:DNA-3-methyladenine glycosylase II
MTFTETQIINALAPFDFNLSAQIFANTDRQVRAFADGCFSQVIQLDGKLILVNLTSKGTVDKPKLKFELKSNSTISLNEKNKSEAIISYIFNLKLPLNEFYEEIKADITMSHIAQKLYGLKNPTTPTVFEAIVDSIVEQQISIKVARTIEERLAKKFGDRLDLDGESYFVFPTPQNLANADAVEIRLCGLSQRKAEYIKEAAQLIAEGKLDLEHMKNHSSPEQIIAELDDIRGIGIWTAELTMLRGMQKLDALPADDFGIRRVISRYYCAGKPIKAAEAREIANVWGRWKGLAAFYLIVAETHNIMV